MPDINLTIRYLRIFSGMILFVYVVTHLANHSLGIISLSAMEAGRVIFLNFWRSTAIAYTLYGALIVHVIVGIYALCIRKTTKLSFKEWVRNISAVLIPFFLASHLAMTLYGSRVLSLSDNYHFMIVVTWVFDPVGVAGLTVMLILVWVHAAIGIHGLLQFRQFYIYNRRLVLAFYWLFPTLALLGYYSAGMEAKGKASLNADFILETLVNSRYSDEVGKEILRMSNLGQFQIFPLVFISILSFYFARFLWTRSRRDLRVTYPDGKVTSVSKGTSILEASQQAGLSHESVCGGRGRCTTCRIKVLSDITDLPPPNQIEKRVIDRLKFDESVRLACQLRIKKDIKVVPLISLSKQEKGNIRFRTQSRMAGTESRIVVLFTDLRGFTQLSDSKLPYDVVYILNKYFRFVVQAIEANKGKVDKFIGDGVMAIFNDQNDLSEACKNSINAAADISKGLEKLNIELQSEIENELRIGIGIHMGNAIVGQMGYGKSSSETAIGDTVNVASRLEQLTKEHKCELIISKALGDAAKVKLEHFTKTSVNIRGKRDLMKALILEKASDHATYKTQ